MTPPRCSRSPRSASRSSPGFELAEASRRDHRVNAHASLLATAATPRDQTGCREKGHRARAACDRNEGWPKLGLAPPAKRCQYVAFIVA